MNPLNPTVSLYEDKAKQIGVGSVELKGYPIMYTRVDQILQFEAEYEEIDTRVQDSIVERTQCLPPCSYTEYKLAAEPKKFEPNHKFYLQLSSSKILKRT